MSAFKTCLLGESGVGKTTLTKLLQHQNLNGQRRPTIGVNIEKINTAKGNCCMWDLAGQRRFQFMWKEFMRGANLSIVVTDSTPQNVMLTKDIIERHLANSTQQVIVISNKQDLNGRMSPGDIEAALGVPTYGMVGTNAKNEQALKSIIERHV